MHKWRRGLDWVHGWWLHGSGDEGSILRTGQVQAKATLGLPLAFSELNRPGPGERAGRSAGL